MLRLLAARLSSPRLLTRLVLTTAAAGVAVVLGTGHIAGSEVAHTLQLGDSVQGRPIDISCFNSAEAEGDDVVLIVGGIHTGMEANTAQLAGQIEQDFRRGILTPPRDITVCVIPQLNPDGIALATHTNANHVDLNRNWPSHDWRADAWHPVTGEVSGGRRPLSEPETQVLHEFLDMTRPAAVIVFHCCGSLVEANQEATAVFMAHRYARAAGFGYLGTWADYDTSGEFIDAMDELGVPAMDVELERPEAIGLAEHRAGLRAALAYLSSQRQ